MECSKTPEGREFLTKQNIVLHPNTGMYCYEPLKGEFGFELLYNFQMMEFEAKKSQEAKQLDQQWFNVVIPDVQVQEKGTPVMKEIQEIASAMLNDINRVYAGILEGRKRIINAKPVVEGLSEPHCEYLKYRLFSVMEDALDRLFRKREDILKCVKILETVRNSFGLIASDPVLPKLDIKMGLIATFHKMREACFVTREEECLSESKDWDINAKIAELSKRLSFTVSSK